MHLNKFVLSLASLALMFWGANTSSASQIPWKTPSGTIPGLFTYDNGGTSDQLFVPAGTDPVVTATGLSFFPSDFKAESSNGTTAPDNQVSDKLSFDIHVIPNNQLTNFVVDEYGDYSIQGTGPHTGVKVFGSVFLTNLDTNVVVSASLSAVPPTPAALFQGSGVTSGQGTWQGEEAIATIPTGWKNIRVELDNVLQASSDPGTNSFIEKKVVTPGVEINVIIPEPATVTLGLIGAGLFMSRRRRVA
jgi:hypothetical protein